MAPSNRSLADAAAAVTTTRSGRITTISNAAKESIASEKLLEQKDRRANAGTKKKASANLMQARKRKGLSASQNIALPPVVSSSQSLTSATRVRPHLSDVGNHSARHHPPAPQPRAAAEFRDVIGLRSPIAAPPHSVTRSQGVPIVPNGTRTGQPLCRPASVPPDTESKEERSIALRSKRQRLLFDDTEDEEMDGVIFGDGVDGPGEHAGPREQRIRQAFPSGWTAEEEDEEEEAPEGPPIGDGGRIDDEEGGDDDDTDGAPINAIKITSRASRNSKPQPRSNPKASDYDAASEILLNGAASFARCIAVAEDPFAGADSTIQIAEEAWQLSQQDRPMLVPGADVEVITIVRHVFSQIRGKVKDVARARVVDTYGFHDRPHMEQANIRLYFDLIEKDSYTYGDPKTRKGPYFHSLLYKVCKATWFSKQSDDGVLHQEYFTPFSVKTIALVFTAIRMCLDEWKTGTWQGLTFTTDIYKPAYEVHLANLRALNVADPLFIEGLGQELSEDCMATFELNENAGPTVTMSAVEINHGISYAQERRNERHMEKVAAAQAAAAIAHF